MDAHTQAFYRLKFQNTFLRLKGNGFQELFGDIMSRRYPGDFVRTRPWGAHGDRKNDGYLRSERTLFQVYAPNEMSASETVKKIEADFAGALPHWKDFFAIWVFAHNAMDGLGPDVLQCLLDLGRRNSDISVRQWGYEALEECVLALRQQDLEAVLGYAPDARAVNNVRSADLIKVLETIAQTDVAAGSDIKPVSVDKINKNSLSDDSVHYIRMGQRKSSLVRGIFNSFTDPLRAERIVQSFRTKYMDLKLQGLTSDRMLSELIRFTGGYSEGKSGPVEAQRHEAAVAATLAFLFESCDIFEDPKTGEEV